MGLDNGFRVRGLKREDIPCFVKLPFDFDWDDDAIEIAHYRNCWGLRNMILGVLHMSTDCYDMNVDAEDLRAILRNMVPFFKQDYWEDEGDSIWTFDEAFPFTLFQQTINLWWLCNYMEEHPEVTCIFYDSY